MPHHACHRHHLFSQQTTLYGDPDAGKSSTDWGGGCVVNAVVNEVNRLNIRSAHLTISCTRLVDAV
eukprot:1026484-Amorphochlora_amoeboformis.AAC.1